MAFKLAIIGLGKIAQDQHLPVVAKNSDFELAAVVSSREGYRDVPHFKTPAELFRSGLKLDAVALCMPPEPRFAIARDALDAGFHVLMEKPPTPTVGELDAITAHAEKAGRILFTTWHSQYNKAVNEAQRLLSGKRVTRLQVSWKEDVRHWHASPRAAIGFLIHAAPMDTGLLGSRRNVTLPGVSCTVGEQIEALRKVAGDKVVARIKREPNETIMKIVSGWPRNFEAKRGRELGFKAENSFEDIIRVHIEDELGGKIA